VSDLFLTSPGLEIGSFTDTKPKEQILVFVNDVSGSLIRMTTGEKTCIRFKTENTIGAFCLANEQIHEITVKYGELMQVLKFSSYNYSIERSMDQTIITIEGSNAT